MVARKHRYIVVEGPIGAGKTTLARLLAEHTGAGLLLEKPDDNPFLASFYQDRRRWALATQLFFLFQRVNQLAGLKQMDLFERPTVAGLAEALVALETAPGSVAAIARMRRQIDAMPEEEIATLLAAKTSASAENRSGGKT